MKRAHRNVLTVIMLTLGICVLLYPAVSNWLAERKTSSQIKMYETDIGKLSTERRELEWTKATDYNNNLRGNPVKDPFIPESGRALPQNYLDVLNIEGVMCYLEIPSINVDLPVYHGVSDEVLRKGVGHMEGTALPIGTEGGHTLLTGHTGLPSARLFTDLIELKLEDKFYIHVLDQELVYQIDQIKVIEPEDVGDLVAYHGEDYVTLITCTPYGLNTHRLLVRGVRIHQMSKSLVLRKSTSVIFWGGLILAPFFVLVLLLVLLREFAKARRKIKKERLKI